MITDIEARGPLFDGRAEKAAADAAADMEKSVATLGASMIRSVMDRTFKKQTPYYRLKNVATPTFPGWKIHDQKVIYGYWLEGIGSRNKTTRFKGYAIYRRTIVRIRAMAKVVAPSVLARYMGRMGGK